MQRVNSKKVLSAEEKRRLTPLAWVPSTVTPEILQQMVADGVLPPQDAIGWRSANGETSPSPQAGEVVVFIDFFKRGFSLPPSLFLRDFLQYFGLQLHHLNPNGVLQLSLFATTCEAFLGIQPHLAPWKQLFLLKHFPSSLGVGGVSIRLRPGVGSKFPTVFVRDSLGSWRSGWFYASNPVVGLPEFFNCTPDFHNARWSAPPEVQEVNAVEAIQAALDKALSAGLTGAAVLRVFISCRVQPLKERHHPLFAYTGQDDPTRETSNSLPDEEVSTRLLELLDSRTCLTTATTPIPFCNANPPDRASLDLWSHLQMDPTRPHSPLPPPEDESQGQPKPYADIQPLKTVPPLAESPCPGPSPVAFLGSKRKLTGSDSDCGTPSPMKIKRLTTRVTPGSTSGSSKTTATKGTEKKNLAPIHAVPAAATSSSSLMPGNEGTEETSQAPESKGPRVTPPLSVVSQTETPFQPSIQSPAREEGQTSPRAANPPSSNHPEDLGNEPSPMPRTDSTESRLRHDSSTVPSRLETSLQRLSEILKDGPGTIQECIVSTILLSSIYLALEHTSPRASS